MSRQYRGSASTKLLTSGNTGLLSEKHMLSKVLILPGSISAGVLVSGCMLEWLQQSGVLRI